MALRPISRFLFVALVTQLRHGAALAQSEPTTPAASPPPPTALSAELGRDDATAAALTLQRAIQGVVRQGSPFVVTITAYEKERAVAPAAGTATVAAATATSATWVREVTGEELPGHRAIAGCSGFVVSDSGEILTCRSLLLKPDGKFADVVTAETKDGRSTICGIVAAEPTLDLAVLRFEVFPKGCPPTFGVGRFGDSTALHPGDLAFAFGDPRGPEVFFASGVISSLPSRECYQEQLAATYLQTTMVLHPEAYGGPLLDLQGRIVGMLVPRPSSVANLGNGRPMGIEFALPTNIVQLIYKALSEKKSLRSPWLGIAIMSRAELLKERGPEAFAALKMPGFGVMIENTFDPSPAQAAGVRAGDFLVKLDGRPVIDPVTFQRMLYLAGIGAEVKAEFFREGERYERTLKVTERPNEAITR